MRLQNWFVSYNNSLSLFNDGGGFHDNDLLTLHREQEHHESFEVLTEDTRPVSEDERDEVVTPIVELQAEVTTPISELWTDTQATGTTEHDGIKVTVTMADSKPQV